MTNIRVSIKKSHKYEPVDLFRNLQRHLPDAKRLPKGLGLAFFKAIHEAIEEEKFNLVDLSEKWEKYKKKKNWDSRKFIAEGHYKNMIELFYTDGHMTVGFRKSRVHPRSRKYGMPRNMGEIALELEFGNPKTNLPPRPLWRKTIKAFFAEVGPDVHKEIKRILEDENERIF